MRMPGRVAMDEPGQYRPSGLFELQEHHIVRAAALEQRDISPQTDAADPDDLMSDVDQSVATQRSAPMWRQGGQVPVQPDCDAFCISLWDSCDQGRLVHDLPLAAAPFGEARQ